MTKEASDADTQSKSINSTLEEDIKKYSNFHLFDGVSPDSFQLLCALTSQAVAGALRTDKGRNDLAWSLSS